MQQALYEQFDVLKNMGMLELKVPLHISNNLNPNFKIRPYQKEAFSRFTHFIDKYPNKTIPINLLFNMATWSGKTFVMSGLILDLYNRWYRNFLFFVNSSNIIEKTKDNFLNTSSSKYLFNKKLTFNDKIINIKEVSNFSTNDTDNINIKFTTIQWLHSDLTNIKENNLSYEDFKDKKICILSDESHHINSLTKSSKLNKTELEEKNSWEWTVMKILNSNKENLLLEFTATLDFNNKNIVDKYHEKIIFKYHLKEFRRDWYSKEVDIISSELKEKERILWALILSQYRLKIALKNNIQVKPVILFKAQKTIAESEENKTRFNDLINKLQESDLLHLKETTDIKVIKKAFNFFELEKINSDLLIRELKEDFSEEKTISANDKSDLVSVQLNTLENKNNPIRAIFAVAKLNEGWDVLNLFDIVRLYNTRSVVKNKAWPQTIAEAQLIWRWARYFPFSYETEEKYKRKFDLKNDELKILETFYYHSVYNVEYISELKQALKNEWMLEENTIEKELKLKDTFKKTEFYKTWIIYTNKKIINNNEWINSLEKAWIKTKRFDISLLSWLSKTWDLFWEEKTETIKKEVIQFKIKNFENNVILKAINRNNFYKFNNLQLFFPKLKSISNFIKNESFLWSIKVNIEATKDILVDLSNENQLYVLSTIFKKIEAEIKEKKKEYKWTKDFNSIAISKTFDDKILSLQIWSERANWMQDFILDKEWFTYDNNFWTSEEKELVRYFQLQVIKLQEKYNEIYLIRNERHFAIYSFDDWGRFEPDFVLFMKDKNSSKQINYQIFIEPKWNQFKDNNWWFENSKESWKNKFLLEIENKFEIMELEFWEYKLIWLPFYNKDMEEEFDEEFKTLIK